MPPKLESGYKADMVKAIKKAGGFARRIEDQYAVGILDLLLSMPATGMVNAEAKRFTGTFFEPSPRQFIEMCDIDRGGGCSLLVGIKGERYYLHECTGPDDPRKGRVLAENCVIQRDGETIPAVFVRWYKERINGKR